MNTQQLSLVGNNKSDCTCIFWKKFTTRRGLSCSMNDLCALDPYREVVANKTIMIERFLNRVTDANA